MQINVKNSQELLKREELGLTKPFNLQLPRVPLLAVSSQIFFFSSLNSEHLHISSSRHCFTFSRGHKEAGKLSSQFLCTSGIEKGVKK